MSYYQAIINVLSGLGNQGTKNMIIKNDTTTTTFVLIRLF